MLNGQSIQFMVKVVPTVVPTVVAADSRDAATKGEEKEDADDEVSEQYLWQLEVLHEAQCQGPALGDGPNAAGRAVADAASK